MGLGGCAALAATCIVVTAMPSTAATTCSTVSGAAAGSVTAAGITLSQQQATNAMAVVVAGRLTGMSNRDEAIAIMTGYTESSIRRLSNPAVAGSSSYPNDGSGTDHDSVGVFQQRPSWGPTSVLMDAAGSANLFYNRLATVANRDSQTMWADAQAVQVSAYPDGSNYEPYANFGTQLVAQWAGQNLPVVVNCDGHTSTGGTKTFSPALARFGGNTWTFYSTNIVNGTGVTDQMVTWSGTLASDVPLVGDWNGDGVYTPGLARFSGSTWTFYLTNIVNGTGVTDQMVTWSGTLASDRPLAGDWNGDGKDSPGLARLSGGTRTYYLTNIVNGTGVTDQFVTWSGATASDVPLVGPWT
ncbi:MAG: hypothetical protein M3Y42_06700 [Actinomycetota bacterium]|nr:hypothetical protein [Actinomycetota bacterium]